MFRSIVTCLMCLVLTSLVSAQTVPPGYRLVCRNGVCSLVRIQQPQYATISSPRIVVSATPATYRTFAVDPIPEPDASPVVSAPDPVVTRTTCDCWRTGICTCDPATCACSACLNGQVRMGNAYAPITQYATASPYVSTTMYAAPSYASVRYSAYGAAVAVTYDGFGNAYVTHSGGGHARRMARWTAKGIRRGWSS